MTRKIYGVLQPQRMFKMKCIRVCAAFCLTFTLCIGAAAAQETQSPPEIAINVDGKITNIYVVGDAWAGVIAKVQELRQIPSAQDAEVVGTLRKNMDALPPVYIYELVRRTCVSNPKEAGRLFHLAGVRMRYDAYRCTDQTAAGGIQATLMSLPLPDCKAALEDDTLRAGAAELVGAKELFSSKASPWWICSHGMDAVMAGLSGKTLNTAEWLTPEDKWQQVRESLSEAVVRASKAQPK
jgi:hypothetical protein